MTCKRRPLELLCGVRRHPGASLATFWSLLRYKLTSVPGFSKSPMLEYSEPILLRVDDTKQTIFLILLGVTMLSNATPRRRHHECTPLAACSTAAPHFAFFRACISHSEAGKSMLHRVINWDAATFKSWWCSCACAVVYGSMR